MCAVFVVFNDNRKKMIITIAVFAGSPVENPGEGEEGARGGGVLVQLVRPQLLR